MFFFPKLNAIFFIKIGGGKNYLYVLVTFERFLSIGDSRRTQNYPRTPKQSTEEQK